MGVSVRARVGGCGEHVPALDLSRDDQLTDPGLCRCPRVLVPVHVVKALGVRRREEVLGADLCSGGRECQTERVAAEVLGVPCARLASARSRGEVEVGGRGGAAGAAFLEGQADFARLGGGLTTKHPAIFFFLLCECKILVNRYFTCID